MNDRMKTYNCTVRDPERPDDAPAFFPGVRAVSEKHADRQARDGFTGLLGVPEGLQERLEVQVDQVPGP